MRQEVAEDGEGASGPVERAAGVSVPLGDGERRHLTVLFADLVGSVALAAQMDPEDWREVIAQYHVVAASVVARFEGSVKQYMGDGVLVCFGHPLAHEDDAERAVRAGLELVDAVRRLDPRVGGRSLSSIVGEDGKGDPLRLRVGIHTGVSVVSDSRDQPAIFGDTPNVAARVQAEAEPGSVFVTDATLRLVEGRFSVEPRGVHHLKGVREPAALHRIVNPTPQWRRLDSRAIRLTPFVGRDEELTSLLAARERARTGAGQTILVTSEAGVGKSRLLYQFRRHLGEEGDASIEFRCTPYSQGTAFQPLVGALQEQLGFRAGDTEAEKLDKLVRELDRLGYPAGNALPLLAELLGLASDAGYLPARMSAEFKRSRTLDALTAWHLRMARPGPLLLLIEDLQWCDPSSLEVFGRLVKESATAQLLIVATARPEFSNPWTAGPEVAHLHLERLSERDARRIIIQVAKPATLPGAVIDEIVVRADGVPLYLEELTKAVVESGTGASPDRPRVEIPSTLQDSLTARLDRLSTAREVAQLAAVLGREFGYELAAASLGMDEASLRKGLERLVQAEILHRDGEPPQARYQFKHALLQEAAYGSLLHRTCRRLHGRVVDVLLQGFPERVQQTPELVARHAEAASRTDTAIEYYRRAGTHAQKRSANEEAIRHFCKAISLLERGRRPERDRIELSLQLALGASLTAARGYGHGERRDAYERARVLAEALGDRDQLGQALIGLSIFQCISGSVEPARDLAARVLRSAEKDGNRELVLHGHCQVAVPEHYQGRFASSLAHAEAALAIYDPPRDQRAAFLIGGDTGIAAMAVSAWNLWYLGFPDRALARARETVELSERLENPFGIGFSNGAQAIIHWLRGEFEEQRRAALRQIEVGREYGFPLWVGLGKLFHGVAGMATGDAAAHDRIAEGLALAGSTGTRVSAPLMLAMVASARAKAGATADALDAVDLGLAVAAETGQPFQGAELHRLKGELELADPRTAAEERAPRAQASFGRALDIARAQGARSFELRVITSLASLLACQGRGAELRESLASAYGSFTEGFATADLRRARQLLAVLA